MIPMVRGMLIGSAVFILIPSAIWISSIHVEHPARLALIWIAIPLGTGLSLLCQELPPTARWTLTEQIDLFGLGILVFVIRASERYKIAGVTRWSKYFQFYPGKRGCLPCGVNLAKSSQP